MITTKYRVTGMSCAHCEAAIQAEVSRIPGVQAVEVSARTGELILTSAAPIDKDAVVSAVDEAGYEAVLSQ